MIRYPHPFLCALLPLLLAASSCCAAVYQCKNDGAVVYTDQPCDDESRPAPPLPALPTMPAFRPDPSAPIGKIRPAPARRQEKPESARQKQCARLDLRRRWAEQDMQGAQSRVLRPQDKQLDNARRKARRADEQYRLECAAPS